MLTTFGQTCTAGTYDVDVEVRYSPTQLYFDTIWICLDIRTELGQAEGAVQSSLVQIDVEGKVALGTRQGAETITRVWKLAWAFLPALRHS